MQESITTDSLSFAAPGEVGSSSFVAPMMSEPMGFRDIEQNEAARAAERLSRSSSRRGHSISFGGGVEELAREPVAVVLLRSRPGSAGGPTMLPGLRDSRASIRDQDLSNQVSHPSVNLESGFFVDALGARQEGRVGPAYSYKLYSVFLLCLILYNIFVQKLEHIKNIERVCSYARRVHSDFTLNFQ